MRNILLPILILECVFALSSCSSTYIYSTLNSANAAIDKTDHGDFFYENDSLWISYSLRGADAPLQITVFNKLNKPLFIDWKKSLLVYNGIKHSYMRTDIVFSGDQYGEAYVNSEVVNKEQMAKMLNTPQHVSCVLPKMMVSHRTFDLMGGRDLGRYRKGKMDDLELKAENGKSVKVEGLLFDYSNSPMQIASYINTYYDSPETDQTYAIDLYMANIIRTHTKPKKMPQNMAERGDVLLYKRKPSYRFWKSLGKGAAMSGIAITSIAADAYFNRDED